MFLDSKLNENISAQHTNAYGSQLAPTLSQVNKHSQKLSREKDSYKELLQELAQSSFVKEMYDLQTNIIG